jgi:hypothetical protein
MTRELLAASAGYVRDLALSEHDPAQDLLDAIEDTHWLAFDWDMVDERTIACAAVGPVISWLCSDEADEQLAAALLRERPGDTDLTAMRARVREVLDALTAVLDPEYPMEGR